MMIKTEDDDKELEILKAWETEPVSCLLGGEEGGCCGVLIAGHDGAMLALK